MVTSRLPFIFMNDSFCYVGGLMELFDHNRIAYESVCRAFNSRALRTCVIHPTGTGKSYIALQLIEDNREKRIFYVISLIINLDAFEKALRENIKVGTIDFSLYRSILNFH